MKAITEQSQRQRAQTLDLLDKRLADRAVDDLRWLLSTERGRRVAYLIAEEFKALCPVDWDAQVKDGVANYGWSSFARGWRALSEKFLGMLDAADIAQTMAMIREQITYREEELAVRQRAEHAAAESGKDTNT